MTDVRAVAESFIKAYNDFDVDAIVTMLDDNVELAHHNRGFATSGRQATEELFRGAPQIMPDRQFTDRAGITVDGNVAIIRHVLVATPTVDMAFGPAGEKIYFPVTTVLTVTDEGKVIRYEDYG